MVNDKNVTFYTVYADRKPKIRQIGSGEFGGGEFASPILITEHNLTVLKMDEHFRKIPGLVMQTT